jgi:enoyl-CoA hydratase/carnithine racemase
MDELMVTANVSCRMADGIAEVQLTRTDKANALSGAMFDDLIAAGRLLAGVDGLRVAVISGAGPGFCAGIDMSVLEGMEAGRIAGERDLVSRTHGICNRFQYAAWIWRELPVPVIAAVHGYALGGGFQLSLGADMRYVAPDTRLSVMEIRWGLVPDMAGTQLMRHLAREDIVRELSYTGRIFSGTEAFDYGFATRVTATPLDCARETARAIAAKSPEAVRAMKRLLNNAVATDPRAGLIEETIEQQALVDSPAQIAIVRAGRLEKEIS